MPIINNLFEKYKNTEVFVESGSHVGEGIQRALDAGFTNIISVELAQNYYYHCIMRFNGNSLGKTRKSFNARTGDN
jgi:hypothetical protein